MSGSASGCIFCLLLQIKFTQKLLAGSRVQYYTIFWGRALYWTKYSPVSLIFGLEEDDDPDPGLLWSVQRVVTPPPWYHMSIILHKLRERNGPANDSQKWPNSFHWPPTSSPPFLQSAINRHLPIHIILMLVCYLQSCECKEFLLFMLLVLWIAEGILKNIRTIKLEQLFSKYLILWTLHCGNSRALAVSGRASEWSLFNVQNLHQTFINLTQLAPPLVNKKFW